MNPTRLRLLNFRTFERLELELPLGTAGVVGVNGAGKSSIVGAPELVLFGPPGRQTLAGYLSEAGGDRVELELELEHRDDVYRVRRAYSASGRGKTTLDFERLIFDAVAAGDVDGYNWASLTQGNIAETQAHIEKTLGLDRDTFRASAFLAQGDGAAFTEAEPRERKRILASVLGLERWARRRDAVAEDRRQATREGDALRAAELALTAALEGDDERRREVDSLKAQIAQSATVTAGLEKRIETRVAEIGAMTAALERFELVASAADSARRLQQDHAARERHVDENVRPAIDAMLVELETLTTGETLLELETKRDETIRRRDALAAQRAEYEAAVRELGLVRARRADLIDRGVDVTRRAAEALEQAEELEQPLDEEAPRCEHCGQAMGDEARKTAAASYRRRAAELVAESETLRSQHDAIVVPTLPDEPAPASELEAMTAWIAESSMTISIAKGELERRAEIEHELRLARARVAEIESDEFRARMSELEEAALDAEARLTQSMSVSPDEIDVQTAKLVDERNELEGARALDAQRRQRLGGLLEKVERADAQMLELETTRRQIAEVDVRAADLAVLEQAFGRDGVPAWIVEQRAIPAIEAEACRLLEDLGGPITRVELRTERALKGGGTSDELDIVCVTEAGERDYSTFSGGERTRVNLALRIALARLLATRRGAESRLLAIDEPEFLDEDGTSRLVAVLRAQTQSGAFDRVLLVSHVPTLREAFDTVLAVEKVDGASRVEVM